eukprot:CAMPEP_0167780496 /NCGR_PEP_ID=MMETSP0111_2-20121227/5396_1 /TAXON_ID=91324 /ORGANISM="Lotharella globosa, Strain CCCM811" /LENGTH=75 /DNA_ID=CAMNT_0007671027 /DNA_START=121 /DNA_END=348 /DNA_ORIENTATION=+
MIPIRILIRYTADPCRPREQDQRHESEQREEPYARADDDQERQPRREPMTELGRKCRDAEPLDDRRRDPIPYRVA